MRRCPNPERRPPTSAGFTLVEIAVVIVVLSLLLAMIAGFATSLLGQQKRQVTRQRIAGIETAIALFVSQNRRLPCPANGTLDGATNSSAGKENPDPATGTCNINQQHGVVPWQALGLSEQDVTDGWGNRMTYRASPDFVGAGSMNFTRCDPAGTAAAVALSLQNGYCRDPSPPAATFTPGEWTDPKNVTNGRGLNIRTVSGTVVMDSTAVPSTGAAYVVVSHGENGKGAYTTTGNIRTDWRTPHEDEERKNSADLALAAHFVDDFAYDDAGPPARYFDDFVLRPSILNVATKAQLGPRAH